MSTPGLASNVASPPLKCMLWPLKSPARGPQAVLRPVQGLPALILSRVCNSTACMQTPCAGAARHAARQRHVHEPHAVPLRSARGLHTHGAPGQWAHATQVLQHGMDVFQHGTMRSGVAPWRCARRTVAGEGAAGQLEHAAARDLAVADQLRAQVLGRERRVAGARRVGRACARASAARRVSEAAPSPRATLPKS